ncbi:hypothetical protein NOF04DRAFT_1318999 [Fusarium oxysporum II5]|nr:hypothetical protein DER44DRAFT_773288 [Fusarium oxysporum]KAK2131242.1 hypothetical protein NOF04DRAFT_1318999 [Fusarium oxysporum II5]
MNGHFHESSEKTRTGRLVGRTVFLSVCLLQYSIPIRFDFQCDRSQADHGGMIWLALDWPFFASSTIRLYFAGSRLEFRLMNGYTSIAHTCGQRFDLSCSSCDSKVAAKLAHMNK